MHHQGVATGNIKNVDNVIMNTGSTNLNSSIKKVTGSGKASGIRTSTGRSQGGIPGATDTKGSNSSQVINRKSNTGGGSQSTRKQQSTTNYINKNNLIEGGAGSASVNQNRIKASAAIAQNSNLPDDHVIQQQVNQSTTFSGDGSMGH